MAITPSDLEKMAHLACLDIHTDSMAHLNEEIRSIMDFVEQLREVNTQHVAPLFHPLAQQQRLREDVVTEDHCVAQLEQIAPLFKNNEYLVPQVIDSGR